jgi:hypothetical protein
MTDGLFHGCWAVVLMKQKKVDFEAIKPKYYQNYKYVIKKNKEFF